VISFLSAGVASLVVAYADNVVTQAEWITGQTYPVNGGYTLSL
jgi:hypothetical protein